MPETSSEAGQRQAQAQQDRTKTLEEPPRPPSRDVAPQPAAGSQCWSSGGGAKQKQQRPSVLRQVSHTASRQQHETSVAVPICKEEVDARCLHQYSSPQINSPHQSLHLLSIARNSAKHSSVEARLHEGSIPEGMSVLFMGGLCRWPGCDAGLKDFPSFLKHLHSEHCHSDRSIAQWRLQQDIVQRMESQKGGYFLEHTGSKASQYKKSYNVSVIKFNISRKEGGTEGILRVFVLILEKQKLVAMQLHLHLFEHKYTDLPHLADGDRVQQWDMKHLEELSQRGYRAAGSSHLLTDLVSSVECYKYNNIRPPYTYAYLIRWSILESPDKQRTLNEIYNWFTTMFFYFRHNTATWKNAVRHNLSLHKCFVRVEGGKGAVWTVDEAEYQRRKGQKYHRDCPVKWLTSYSHLCPEEP